LGSERIQQLDQQLAQVFEHSLPDLGIFSFITSRAYQANLWLPTWLHFASAYGLKEFTVSLLKSPASARACFVRNNADLRPIDVAIKQGHWDIVRILNDYITQVELAQKQLTLDQELASHTLFGNKRDYVTPSSSSVHSWPQIPLVTENHHINGRSVNLDLAAPNARNDALTYSPFDSNGRIMKAKSELLLLIEKFKCGISIECFGQMFSKWEAVYKDVLQGQMSLELEYSLNQIRKLCSEDGLASNDQSEDELTSDVSSGTGGNADSARLLERDYTTSEPVVLNEANTRPNAIRTQTRPPRFQPKLNHGHTSTSICSHHKVTICCDILIYS